jgi:hypothetical protein
MTLTLVLSEELETRLRSAARAKGTDEVEAARQLLDRALPPVAHSVPPKKSKRQGGTKRDSARGEFAHVATSADDFARRKQEDIRREEAGW